MYLWKTGEIHQNLCLFVWKREVKPLYWKMYIVDEGSKGAWGRLYWLEELSLFIEEEDCIFYGENWIFHLRKWDSRGCCKVTKWDPIQLKYTFTGQWNEFLNIYVLLFVLSFWHVLCEGEDNEGHLWRVLLWCMWIIE